MITAIRKTERAACARRPPHLRLRLHPSRFAQLLFCRHLLLRQVISFSCQGGFARIGHMVGQLFNYVITVLANG